MDEINTIDLAIENLDRSSSDLLHCSYAPENYNTAFGEMLANISHEMWKLSRKMKQSREEYVL
jgi:hypothetical protein